MLIVLLQLLTAVFVFHFISIVYSEQQAAANGVSAIEVKGGVRYLLLPLVVTVITITGVIDRRLDSAFFKKAQGGIIFAALLCLLFIGWWMEMSVVYFIESMGYRDCGTTYSGVWLNVSLYAHASEACP
ncbi:hypothetical protein O5O45_21435 [Hahella aquimaris]|uniref:hypothetical protein n=1 Tax=Hahella sp. HNIBRBA332 TaxID=3015983 RepID=UPI00273C8DF2|nr:hypothetical protein [Hahella sp. HNIBRBA332]WLQ12292.1 hypothetical protein O5O45_21435 [Hahella sp. HNIBRBA332]